MRLKSRFERFDPNHLSRAIVLASTDLSGSPLAVSNSSKCNDNWNETDQLIEVGCDFSEEKFGLDRLDETLLIANAKLIDCLRVIYVSKIQAVRFLKLHSTFHDAEPSDVNSRIYKNRSSNRTGFSNFSFIYFVVL